MKDHAPTGEICKDCETTVAPSRDGGFCGCPRRTLPGPGAVAARAAGAVAALRRAGLSGRYHLVEE